MAGQQRDLVLHRLDDTEASYRQTQVEMSEAALRVPRTGSAVSEIARTNRDAGSHRRQSGTIADVEV